MHEAQGHTYPESGELMLVTDKRSQRLKPAQREGERLAIAELGSKAVYEVYAEQFITVTPYK
ncbi:MAG: hypothetical protein ACRERE_13675 [Candidatus Entotheonellia bacterium]